MRKEVDMYETRMISFLRRPINYLSFLFRRSVIQERPGRWIINERTKERSIDLANMDNCYQSMTVR